MMNDRVWGCWSWVFLVGVTLVAAGLGIVPVSAADQPASLPRLPFHLTARPFEPLDVERDKYLDAIESLCTYLAELQDEQGAIIDPFLGREHQYATPYFAHPVGVLLEAGRAPQLREAGIRAMDHATACLASGSAGIPDRHGEFFIAPLTEALELYRNHVDEKHWQVWRERLSTPLDAIMQDQHGRINNWRTYAMKGQWLRHRAGLVDRNDAITFITDAWMRRTQRERIVADKWNMYQDWSSDPQSHAVEMVGRGNLLALVRAGYDGPHSDAIWRCVRRGSAASLLWQDPTGQCPPNGRTDNHVFNDVLMQLICDVMAEDAHARGDGELAGQYRRAAMLSFQSIRRWKRAAPPRAGSYYVTKNHFDPAERVGYQPASQYTNYNGAVAYHLAEAYQARHSSIAERPTPAEIGGYVVTADPAFSSAVVNAGGMQVMFNLRGDTVSKSGEHLMPVGAVRLARAGCDRRLGPPDGVHEARSGRAATFGPTWRAPTGWVRLAEQAEHYRGTMHAQFVHPLLVRFHVHYHSVTGRGGPVFRHEFILTPDGALATLHASEDRPFGVTLPVLENDGRPLRVEREAKYVSVSYPDDAGTPGDAQNFLLLDKNPQLHFDEPIRSAVGDLRPVRVTSDEPSVALFVYPSSAGDPAPADVLDSFQREADGYRSVLGSVRGNIYLGRTSAGGRATRLDINDDGQADIQFDIECNFVVQLRNGQPVAIEVDRDVSAECNGRRFALKPYVPVNLARSGTDSP